MKDKKQAQAVSRRDFIKYAGAGTIAAGMGPAFLFPERAAAQQKTLKILQWSHFVPAWDEWFNKTFTVEWGQKHDTKVIVDNINLVDIAARAASEAQAQKGTPPDSGSISVFVLSEIMLLAGELVTARHPCESCEPIVQPRRGERG